MSYVDGFVLAVPKKNLGEYRKQARRAAKVWKSHGALSYVEAVADDVKKGKLTSFPQAVKLKPNEVVVFSYVLYKSRGDRNRIMKKVMSDPRLADMMKPENMPYDGSRMFWGGFKTIIEI